MTEHEKRENVINGLGSCVEYFASKVKGAMFDEWLEESRKAIALLKAQEPVEPKKNDVELLGLRTWDWACPECNCILIYRANYCSCCGRAVKWE